MQRSPISTALRETAPPQARCHASGLPLTPQASSLKPRRGFTLVELIVVILIISILAAMLFPAINNVRRQARIAQVTVDIRTLEKAITDFKLKFGVEPPSSFVLYERASDWSNTDALTRNSIAFIRQAWPSFDFTNMGDPTSGSVTSVNNSTTNNQRRDFNNDGDETDTFYMSGAECLVFFLAGAGVIDSTSPNSTGFSTLPTMPFQAGGTRVGPFYELDASRLANVDGDSVPELLDPLPGQTMPYQYFSSYGGRGYQIFGYNTDNNNSLTTDDEVVYLNGATTPTMYSEYLKNDSIGLGNGNPSYTPTGMTNVWVHSSSAPWNQKTFQIISPGFDAGYGVGGLFTNAGVSATSSGIATTGSTDTYRNRTRRQEEADNITNFSGGALLNFYNAW